MAVAIFSLYSVHLLLKTANEGGEVVPTESEPAAFRGLPEIINLFHPSQARWCTSSSVTKPSGCRGSSLLPAPSPCRTSEVRVEARAAVFSSLDASGWKMFPNSVVSVPAAMSSYLFIVKYELPIVIQSFLGSSNG